MKYGDTLHQRSIPEWGTYNVDYNDIKHLIKVRTTKGQAEAISIPGQGHESNALQDFEEELYAELYEQHQRIDLFVQSKSGEITRRLSHLHKQVIQLRQRDLPWDQTRISLRRLEKFSKAEEDVLKAGEEIQSLARFVGAQRLAFQKLLKKYRKWTGSQTLGTRFQKDVLSRPTSFSKRNFEPLLTQWTDVLAAVRAPFDAGATWTTGPTDRRGSRLVAQVTTKAAGADGPVRVKSGANKGLDKTITSAVQIHTICETGSDVDVDTALAVLPLGRAAGKAAYWVHPDNVVELHVLLLQYMRLRNKGNPSTSTSNPPSSRSSQKESLNGRTNGSIGAFEDEACVIICDDLRRFAEQRSSATINESENVPGATSEAAAASIRYTSKGEAVVVVGTSSDVIYKATACGRRRSMQKAKLKHKYLPLLFVPGKRSWDSSGIPAPVSDTDEALEDNADPTQSFERVRKWLSHHEEVKPLVHLESRRTRFVGLGNNEMRGVWGTLDRDISMRKANLNHSKNAESSANILETFSEETEDFPHAILEIRWEGGAYAGLMRALDESHLTERIRGFSLETHAVAKLYRPEGMPPPSWLPALDQDIRKVPSPAKTAGSSNSRLSPDSPSTRPTSTSATSLADGPTGSGFSATLTETSATSVPDMLESPPLSAFKRKRRIRKQHSQRKQIDSRAPSQYQRYWNEFDDGDEAPENEAYTIFIDPNAPNTFPGAAALSALITTVAFHAHQSTEKVRLWLSPRPDPPETSEHAPLISGYLSPRPDSQDSDLESDSSVDQTRFPSHPHYTTFPTHSHYSTFPSHHPLVRSRDRLLTHCSIAAFLASFIVLGIATILAFTGRGKEAVAVDAGAVVGMVASLMAAAMGVVLMIARRKKVGWMGWVWVGAGIFGVGVGCTVVGVAVLGRG